MATTTLSELVAQSGPATTTRDREPLAPPFNVGQWLRYTGNRETFYVAADGTEIPILHTGREVQVTKTHRGYRGHDAEHQPTQDGWSMYTIWADDTEHRAVIWPKDAGEWEVIE